MAGVDIKETDGSADIITFARWKVIQKLQVANIDVTTLRKNT